MKFLAVEIHTLDTLEPAFCAVEQCDWISLVNEETSVVVLKCYQIGSF
jgi:hypothetical protein